MADYTFDVTKPGALDLVSQGDDELRSTKTVLKAALQGFTTFPANPTCLKAGSGLVFVGTDAERLAVSPLLEGMVFITTDTTPKYLYYVDSTLAWILGCTLPGSSTGKTFYIPCGAGITFASTATYVTATKQMGQGATGEFGHGQGFEASVYDFSFAPSVYGYNPTVKFVVALATDADDTAHTVYARLYNVSDGEAITGSEVTHIGTGPARKTSGALTIGSGAGQMDASLKNYRIEMKVDITGNYGAILGAWLEVTEG